MPKEAPKRDEWMTTLPPERKVRIFFVVIPNDFGVLIIFMNK